MPHEHFACPHCGKRYRWSPKIAGKKSKCAQCAERLTVPETVTPDPPPDDGYDLLLGDDDQSEFGGEPVRQQDDAPPEHDGHCPSCNSSIAPHAVICMNCGFNLQDGQAIQTDVQLAPEEPDDPPANNPRRAAGESPGKAKDKAPPVAAAYAYMGRQGVDAEALAASVALEMRRKEYIIPAITIGVAMALTMINLSVLTPYVAGQVFEEPVMPAVIRMAIGTALEVVLSVPVLLATLFIVAALAGTSFGDLKSAMIKLVAITLAATAAATTVDLILEIMTGGWGFAAWMLKMMINFTIFFSLCTWLLESDTFETILIWLISRGITIGLIILVFIVFGMA